MHIRKLAVAAVVTGFAVLAAPGASMAATSGNVEFTIVKVGINPGTVVARGVLNAVGTEDNNRHLVPPGTPFQVTLSFPQGQLFQTVTPAAPPQILDFNPTTCVAHVVLLSTTVMTGGTGAFTGASGAGTGTANRTIITNRNPDGTCKPLNTPSLFELSQVKAPSTLTVP